MMLRRYHSMLTAFVLVIVGLFGSTAFGDDSQPGYLELRETTANRYSVLWRTPIISGRRASPELLFTGQVRSLTEPALQELPGSIVERQLIETADNGLVGERIEILGLQASNLGALVWISHSSRLIGLPIWMG